jgi:hypothetical protein
MSIIILFSILTSCNLEQVDKYYADYESLISDNYQLKGWLPNEVILSSTTELYSRTNLDINSFLIRFSVNHNDYENIKSQLKRVNRNFVRPNGLKIPAWWSERINDFGKYKFEKDNISRTFAIDNENLTIYCWGKH